MKTLLLLAGRSRRFWPLKEKSLFPICGKTLAEHQVEALRKSGCRDITLVVGAHNKKELKKLFPGLALIEQKDLAMGMQGACLSGLAKVKGGPVMIISGNDVIDPSALAELCTRARKPGVSGAILARKVKSHFPGGYLTVKSGRITAIIEKPKEGKEPSSLVNIVAHVHNDPAALFAALKSARNHRDDGYELALQSLFGEKNYVAVPYGGFWQPVKYPWHFLPLLQHFLSGLRRSIDRSATLHPSAVIEGDVVIGEGVRVLPHATVIGPCFIGRNCIVGTGALVRGSSIGDDCVVGCNTEIKSSVLAGAVWTHMTYLGDSIVGKNVSFGGGCMTGNLRLDEREISVRSADGDIAATGLAKLGLMAGDDCRFGIQVGSNPGARVGPGSFIGGGVFLINDVEDGSYVVMKEGKAVVRKNTSKPPLIHGRETLRKGA